MLMVGADRARNTFHTNDKIVEYTSDAHPFENLNECSFATTDTYGGGRTSGSKETNKNPRINTVAKGPRAPLTNHCSVGKYKPNE